MATLTQDDLLEAIDKMTVLELSEFIKRFEERYGVTAAAPAAAAAAPAAGGDGGAAAGRGRGADRVHRDPDRDRPEQDPGHQGRARADRPRPQGGQGPRRRRPRRPSRKASTKDEAEKIKAALEEQGAKVEIKYAAPPDRAAHAVRCRAPRARSRTVRCARDRARAAPSAWRDRIGGSA